MIQDTGIDKHRDPDERAEERKRELWMEEIVNLPVPKCRPSIAETTQGTAKPKRQPVIQK